LNERNGFGKLIGTGLYLLRRGFIFLTGLLTHNLTGPNGSDCETVFASQVGWKPFDRIARIVEITNGNVISVVIKTKFGYTRDYFPHHDRRRQTRQQAMHPRGVRISVQDVLSYLALGMSEGEILEPWS